jgi:hypothetical protein
MRQNASKLFASKKLKNKRQDMTRQDKNICVKIQIHPQIIEITKSKL